MESKLISVIIAVYNPGVHLIKCLDSVVNQTYRNLQIILVDDGSTDGSGHVCDQYSKNDERITVIHQKNGGVSRARNAGIEVAIGEYYHFLDSDDFIELDTYEYLIWLMNKHDCDAINFEYYITYSDYEDIHLLGENMYGLHDTENAHRIITEGEPFAANKLFSKELIKGRNRSLGIRFREDISRGEDMLFAHTAINQAERVWFDKRPLYHYVQSQDSACRGQFRKSQLTVIKLYDAFSCLLKDSYPKEWNRFLVSMPDQMITIYYDMWSDDNDFSQEMAMWKKEYREKCRKTIKGKKLSLKRIVKYGFFYFAPNLFCVIHKKVHQL